MRLFAFALVLLLAACTTSRGRADQLDTTQTALSAAVRWGDFDQAWTLVDPQWRAAHPLTDLDRERYKQVQISAYRDLRTRPLGNGDIEREVEIGVVNRNTQAERTLHWRERWHYDEAGKHWWLVNGLPDLWPAQ
jgi:hypothetical protein